MQINTSSTTTIQIHNKTNFQYEYKALSSHPDDFKVTFLDTQTNKKVQINIDPDTMGILYKKFKDDIIIEGQEAEVNGDLKLYLEKMWQNFRYKQNFKDPNQDNILSVEEFIQAKTEIDIGKLVNSDKNDEVKYESIREKRDFFISEGAYKKAEENLKKSFERNKITFNDAFISDIRFDTDFNGKITNQEVIDVISKDSAGKALLAENGYASGGLDSASAILRAILEAIKKKQIDIASQITQEEIKNVRIQIDKKEPLQEILNKIDNDKINIKA